jgi:hypothetical protein
LIIERDLWKPTKGIKLLIINRKGSFRLPFLFILITCFQTVSEEILFRDVG